MNSATSANRSVACNGSCSWFFKNGNPFISRIAATVDSGDDVTYFGSACIGTCGKYTILINGSYCADVAAAPCTACACGGKSYFTSSAYNCISRNNSCSGFLINGDPEACRITATICIGNDVHNFGSACPFTSGE